MSTVKQLLRSKGSEVWTVSPDTSVFDAIQQMSDRNVGALLVIEGERCAGIITERDYIRKIALKGRSSRDTPVREIMTEQILYVEPDRTVEECMALMNEKQLRHLPVLEDGRVVGIISIRDAIKDAISSREFMIAQLEHYIRG